MKIRIAALSLVGGLMTSQQACAWGDDGHKTVALIAQQCLTPSVKQTITSMLAADTDNLTKHDFASEATWADKYRDSNHRKDHYEQTQNWHFVDMEIKNPNLDVACFGRTPLPKRSLASNGPARACAIDKIEQFQAELKAADTDAEERLMALKFVMHFVGDIHQPLHSSDNEDRGGNDIKIVADGYPHTSKDELHGFWDTQFVDKLGTPPSALADSLVSEITPAKAKEWAAGTVEDWQKEAFNIAASDTYGNPPLSKDTVQHLDASYENTAENDVKLQLSRAGVRLAYILNTSLGSEQTDWDTCLKGDTNQITATKKRTRR
jgi:hypothetical protein